MQEAFWRVKQVLKSELHQSWFVVMTATGIIAGTILGLVFHINFFGSTVWLIFVALLLIFAYLKPKFAFTIIALIAGMILSFTRIATELKGEDYIQQFYGQTVTITGVISNDPDTEAGTTSFALSELKFGDQYETSGKLYVQISENEDIRREDVITLKGKMTEGFGVYAGSLYRPTLEKWQQKNSLILNLRDWFAERIKSLLPEKEAGLGISYLLGVRTNLDQNLEEDLRTVGLVHIVVASGAHLSILVEAVRKIFGRLSRFSALIFSLLFVILFMTMVGFTPSILRAGLMTILTLVGWYFGRRIKPWRLILIIMAITLLIDPMFVLNLGWLLSFASYAGIMILAPRLKDFLFDQKKLGFIAETILMTISATLMTLPIILYYYGSSSFISILANLLILPTLSIAMGLTFLTGLVAGIPLIETVVAFLTEKILDFQIFVVEICKEMTVFSFQIEPYQWQVFLIYGLIFGLLAIGLIRRKVLKLREVEII